ncbi:MAG: hypothetical protein AB4372_37920 [Xenococcus sp. (in: cyanobacteria)]
MAKIKLSELCPAGSELLQDSESFLTESSDPELENVVGGNSLIVIEKPSFALVTIPKDILIGISIFFP